MSSPPPSSASLPHETLIALIEQNRLDAALAFAGQARMQVPQDAELARLHGICLLRMQRPAEALALFRTAHALAPRSVEVLCNPGSAALAVDDGAAALAALQTAATPARETLRERLARQRAHGGLFDMTGFARDFERLVARITERHRNGDAPTDLLPH